MDKRSLEVALEELELNGDRESILEHENAVLREENARLHVKLAEFEKRSQTARERRPITLTQIRAMNDVDLSAAS